jgi:signal peptide peptidase SppA
MGLRNLLHLIPMRRFRNPPPMVAVLRLDGVIGLRGRRGLTLETLAGVIDRAFSQPQVSAVALLINSPGGSPVQSSLIHRRIRQLAEEKRIPVYAFAEDVAASGGYWLALAADEIYAEETSILGSIGVVSAGFGFAELLRRLGIKRRLYTAGDNKAMLDPFLEEDERGIERLILLQRDIHDAFKDQVRCRRGTKLKGDDATLFSGDVFTGRSALEKGLIDGIGDLRGIMRQRFGEAVRLRLVTRDRFRLFPRVPAFSRTSGDGDTRFAQLGGELFGDLLATVEERLWWSRFGL